MPRKPRPLDAGFLRWVEEYNQWRLQFGWPKFIGVNNGWQGAYFQALKGAVESEEPFPSWEVLTAGAKAGIEGWGFQMPRGSWLLEPRGTIDKNILQMARWGKATKPAPIQRGPALMPAKKREPC